MKDMGLITLTKSLLVVCLILSMLLCGIKATLSPELKEKLDRAEIKMRTVQDIAKSMAEDENTKAYVTGDSKTIRSKVENFGKKWVETAKLEYAEDKEGLSERVGGALSGVGDGVVGFVNGVKNNDWKSGVQGALTIISSLVALAGPAGVIASSVLSLVSSLFDLFGGSQETESMDAKIERIVKEQINIARMKDLKADFEGLKVAYQSLSASVQHFRESKNLEKDQANELYNHAFLELPVFGKIKAMINEICDVKEIGTDGYDKAKECLDTIQMYAEASILRQLLITNMASLMADVHEKDHGIYVEDDDDTTQKNSSGLLIVSNNLLNLIKKEQENDRTAFRFFGDPLDHPSKRFVIGVFFRDVHKFPTLQTYLRSLDKEDSGSIFKQYTMLCTGLDLRGDCIEMEEGDYPDLSKNPKNWINAISSFYLPHGLQLTAFDNKNYGGDAWGPYVGPTVYRRIKHSNDYNSLKIETTERDADKEVRFCEALNMGEGACDSAPVGNYNLKGYNGDNWENIFRSMYIPSELAVRGYTAANQRGTAYVLYNGPCTVNRVLNENKWKSISVAVSTADANEEAELCDNTDLNGHCIVTGVSSNDLRNLGGANFAGNIKSMRIPGGMHITGYTETDMNGVKIGPYKGPAVISRVDLSGVWKSMEITKLMPREDGSGEEN